MMRLERWRLVARLLCGLIPVAVGTVLLANWASGPVALFGGLALSVLAAILLASRVDARRVDGLIGTTFLHGEGAVSPVRVPAITAGPLELVGELLLTASHELRTQLNTIMGFTEALLELEPDERDERQGRYLANILTASQQQLALINDILAASERERSVELAPLLLPAPLPTPPPRGEGTGNDSSRRSAAAANPPQREEAAGSGAKILAIDNSPMAIEVIEALLGPAGYQVIAALDGAAGVALAREEQPSLIILDLTMPDMDGFAVLECLRADSVTMDIPVVVLTGKTLSAGERTELASQVAYVGQKGEFNRAGFVNFVRHYARATV